MFSASSDSELLIIGRGRSRCSLMTPKVQPGFSKQPRKILSEFNVSSSPETKLPVQDVPSSTQSNVQSSKIRHIQQYEENPLEDFLCNMLPRNYNRYGLTGIEQSNKIQARSPPPHYKGISLQEIAKPILSSNEGNFTDFEKDLLTILKKCEFIDRFDIIPSDFFTEWFNMTEDSDMDAKEAKLTTGEGPHKFYLMWRHSVLILTIIQGWLQSLVCQEKVEQFYTDDLEALKDAWVAALADDNKWYRAKVVEVYAGNSVSLKYPDLGDTSEAVSLDRLRHLPSNLWNRKSLCFPAYLAGLSQNDTDWDSNATINKTFIEQLRELDFVTVKIALKTQREEAEVYIWEAGNPQSINVKVNLSITEWKKDIRYGLTPEDIKRVTVVESCINYQTSRLWQIIKVFSPNSFTLRVVNEEDTWITLNAAMQRFYNELEEGRLRIRQGRVEPRQCYVYYCTKSSLWHRVEIVFADNEKKTCQVFLLDSGIFQMTVFDNMRKLTARFCLLPSQAFKCHLAHVTSKTKKWSPEAIEAFKNMAPEESIVVGVVVASSKVETKIGERLNLSIILIENKIDLESAATTVVIKDSMQHKLCQQGFGKPSGIGAAGWSTLQNFIKCKIESPKPSPEFLTQSSQFMWKKSYDYYGKWVDQSATGVRKFIPSEVRKHLCWVKLIRAASPTCIFIQLQEQIPSLMLLMHQLSVCMSDEPELEKEDLQPGMFVAVHCRITGQEDDKHWYRAVVLKKLSLEQLRVIVIDFGVEFTACIKNMSSVKKLPKRFLKEPSYAYRTHLDYPNLVPNSSTTYSKECCQYFRRYVKGWNGACPIYYIWKHENSQNVEVDDIKQTLDFNYSEEKWEKSDIDIEYSILMELKDHPVMSHLFVSTGIIIEYENFNAQDEPYTFSLMHQILIDKQYAMQ